MEQRYAVIDLETTGGRASRDKITEIAIVLFDGRQVIDTFSTLINPEVPIPYGITELTGITQEMVQDAPRFYEVAKQIVEMTEGYVFVAHNVRFDYSFLREEFRRLGFTYSRKTLCTVRLARKTFPGLPSYSLGNLIRHFGIAVNNRHRALDDTLATVDLLQRILETQEDGEEVKAMVNLGIKESLLPRSIPLERIHALPEEVGVYYFHDQVGNVVYVGKSKNIKKRIAQHFAQKTEKARKLQQHVHDISFELTGSELVALLHESYEIKRLRPPINRAQRVRRFPFIVHTYQDEEGYIRFAADRPLAAQRKKLNVLSEYPKMSHARGHLMRMIEEFELCRKLTGMEKGRGQGPCFHYHLKQCHGACCQEESVEAYNERAHLAQEKLTTVFEKDLLIIDQGREPGEHALVLIADGTYQGFGYVEESEVSYGKEHLRQSIKPHPGNPETNRIIRRYLSEKKRGVKVITL
jgi:DNA polymerase-3 subunit epsilon